jgi:hypothetical protein
MPVRWQAAGGRRTGRRASQAQRLKTVPTPPATTKGRSILTETAAVEVTTAVIGASAAPAKAAPMPSGAYAPDGPAAQEAALLTIATRGGGSALRG